MSGTRTMHNHAFGAPRTRATPQSLPVRALPVAALIAALLSLLASVGALAAGPPRLTSAITDQTGLLNSGRDQIVKAQTQLFAETGSQLYVLFVPSTGGQDIADYTMQAATNSGLTGTDILLVVAVQDRKDWIQTGSSLRSSLSQNAIDSIIANDLNPKLQSGDYPGAVVATADGLRTALSGAGPVATPTQAPAGQTPTPTPAPTQSGGGAGPTTTSSGGGLDLLILFIALVVIAIVLFCVLRLYRVREELGERRVQEQLGRQANTMLIDTDDALHTAQQDLGFVQTQLTPDEAAVLGSALAAAKQDLSAAFSLGQKLDDEAADTPQHRRQMLQEIITRCTRVKAAVAQQQARIDQLRELEKHVEDVLAQASTDAATLDGRVSVARDTLSKLNRYAPSSWNAVAGNADAAAQKIANARDAISAGQALVAAGTRDQATVKARIAQSALAEAGTLLDAVGNTSMALDDMASKLPALISHVETDVSQAQSIINAGTAPERRPDLDRAAASLARAKQLAAATPLDVMAAYRQATDANTMVDGVLAGIAQVRQAQARAVAAAQAAIQTATTSVAQAGATISGFASTSAVGRRARTRLAEAQTELNRANSLVATDLAGATQAARNANSLAQQAIGEARTDLTGAGYGSWFTGGNGGGWTPPASGSSGGGSIVPFVIGAIVGGILSGGGGGRHGGGWGGGFGGFGSGGFGGGHGGGGGFGGGGFGGGRGGGGGW